MSVTLLSRRLRQLEAEGLVERRRSASGKSWTYRLGEAGADFLPPLVGAPSTWGRRWTRLELEEGGLDLRLLIWGLEYSVDPGVFGPGRHVLRLEVIDQPAHSGSTRSSATAGRSNFAFLTQAAGRNSTSRPRCATSSTSIVATRPFGQRSTPVS